MNKTIRSYCRLCAKLKPQNKLTNLKKDNAKHQEIIIKLAQLNIPLDFENNLPRTVCLLCTKSLKNAFDFVVSVEQAQLVLNKLPILPTAIIKKEPRYSDEEKSEKVPTPDVKHPNEDNIIVEVKPNIEFYLDTQLQPLNEDNINFETKPVIADINLSLYGSHYHNHPPEPHQRSLISYQFNKDDTKNNSKRIDLSNLEDTTQTENLTWQNYGWKCAYCKTIFDQVSELISHSMQFHNSCNAYQCTDCNTRSSKLRRFLNHVDNHRPHLKQSCHKCFKRFRTIKATQVHKRQHFTTKFRCVGCQTSFATSEALADHVKLYYKRFASSLNLDELPDDLTCPICNKKCTKRIYLKKHLAIHSEKKFSHSCEICGKGFSNKQSLAMHIITHSDIRKFQCDICKSWFKSKITLYTHIQVHFGKKNFGCKQCGKMFRLKKHLNAHEIVHTDLYPHICTYCNKAFRFKTTLRLHLRQHTGDKPYSCEICQKNFTDWANYNKHMKRKHKMNMSKKRPLVVFSSETTTEPDAISVCDERSASLHTLKEEIV